MKKFIAASGDVHLVSLDQDGDEVGIMVDGTRVAYFDHDEAEFVVFEDDLLEIGLSVSVEESVDDSPSDGS